MAPYFKTDRNFLEYLSNKRNVVVVVKKIIFWATVALCLWFNV